MNAHHPAAAQTPVRPTSEDYHRWLAEHDPYLCNTPGEVGIKSILDWLTEIGWPSVRPDAVTAAPIRYVVSPVPLDHQDRRYFQMVVDYRHDGQWVITDGYEPAQLLARDGTWSYPPQRGREQWTQARRYSLDEALDIAAANVGALTCNGLTAAEMQARRDAIETKEGR